MYPGIRSVELNGGPSVKDVNTSKAFMFDQTATKELKILTPTRAARSVIGQATLNLQTGERATQTL